jgi:elongation factor P
MININDIKNGMTIEFDNNIYQILEFLHVKPGKGSAFVRTKLKNLRSGTTIDHTFNAGIKVKRANIDKTKMQYLYEDGENHYFMDNETYDQVEIPSESVAEYAKFLKEQMEVTIIKFGTEVINIELPTKVTYEVTEAPPGVKGDTSSGGSKNVVIETGATVVAPLFINQGDRIVVNTTTGEYDSRSKE